MHTTHSSHMLLEHDVFPNPLPCEGGVDELKISELTPKAGHVLVHDLWSVLAFVSTSCRKNEVARLFVDGMTSQKRFVGKCLPDNYMDSFDDFIEDYALTQITLETFSFEVGNVEKLTKFYLLTFFTDPSYKSSTEFLLFARGTVNRHTCSHSLFV